MPQFSFKGFSTGSQVALSVAQAGNSDAGSVTAWGQANLTTLSILKTEPGLAIAPMPIWVEASDISGFAANGGPGPNEVYDPSFHEITFIWTVTRPNGAAATFAPALNMPQVWNNRNLAYGKKAAFVFDEPGEYTIDLWAIDVNGTTGAATTTVTVGDPVAVITNDGANPDNIILYDPSGDGDPVNYPGADVRTTWSSVRSARDIKGAIPCLILVKRGEQVAGTRIMNTNGLVSNIRIGAFGSGPDPILGPWLNDGEFLIKEEADGPNEELILYGVKLQGGWDSTTENGHATLPWQMNMNNNRTKDYFFLLHQCTVDGFTSCWTPSGAQNYLSHCMFSESTITNWRDYGLFGYFREETDENHVALIGMKIEQHPDALTGGAKNGLYNTHGCFRHSGCRNVIVSASSLFSRCGWSSLSGITADNGALRLNTGANEDQCYIIERVAIEGMIRMVDATGNEHKAGNYLFDKVLQVLGPRAHDSWGVNYAGTTVRNYLGVMLDRVGAFGSSRMGNFLNLTSDGVNALNNATKNQLYNNTFIDLRSEASALSIAFEDVAEGGEFTDVMHENFVNAAPNRDMPVAPNAPLDLVTAVPDFVPQHRGQRYNFDHEQGTLAANVPQDGFISLSYADVGTELYDQPAVGSTDQAYWLAIAGIDTRHKIQVDNRFYHAEENEIEVQFLASEIRVYNRQSTMWDAGDTWRLRLDRASLIPDFVNSQSVAGALVPMGLPTGASSAIDTGDTGLRAYDDFLGAVRPGLGGTDHLGQPRPETGNERGAHLS